MNDKDLKIYEMVLRVRDFATAEAPSFPAISVGGQLFASVLTEAAEVGDQVAAQVSAAGAIREATRNKDVARAALQAALAGIRRTAKSMDQVTPGIQSRFRIPHNPTDQALLATAKSVVSEAASMKAAFISHALPADFIEDLQTRITSFENALRRQNAGKDRLVSATAAIAAGLRRVLVALRQLDAVVPNTFRDNPAKLAAWRSARHVERIPRSKTSKAPLSAPPAA